MADVRTLTPEERAAYDTWVETRPAAVQEVLKRIFPWKLYRIKPSGHRVVLYSVDEEEGGKVSLKVDVLGDFNLVAFERRVFGIDPDDLEECDLPVEGEPLGSADIPIETARECSTRSTADPNEGKDDCG